MADGAGAATPDPGTRVEVRERFSGGWARGFEVAEVAGGSVRLRRLSDGTVLPTEFSATEVRSEVPAWH